MPSVVTLNVVASLLLGGVKGIQMAAPNSLEKRGERKSFFFTNF
jgi:hypothetical protein